MVDVNSENELPFCPVYIHIDPVTTHAAMRLIANNLCFKGHLLNAKIYTQYGCLVIQYNVASDCRAWGSLLVSSKWSNSPIICINPAVNAGSNVVMYVSHDDVIKWKHFPRFWPFVRGIHRSPVNTPHKGQWRGALMFFFYLRMNERLSTHAWGWSFETPSRSFWPHCNDTKEYTIVSIGHSISMMLNHFPIADCNKFPT